MSNLKKKEKLSNYIDSVQYIPLETNINSLIGSISRIAVTPNRIFVGDRVANCVLVFDRQGKYINKINHQGRGPEEYLRLYDFDVVEKDSLIYFYVGNKFQVYDYAGEYKQTIHIQEQTFSPLTIATNTDEIYLYMNYNVCNNKEAFNTVFINKQGKIKHRLFSYSKKIAGQINYSPRLYFRYYNNILLHFNNFENIIYERINGKSKPIFSLDFSQYKLPKISEENIIHLQQTRFHGYALLYNIACVNNKYYALFMIDGSRYMSIISLRDHSVSTINISEDLEYDKSLTDLFLDYVCIEDNNFITYYDWSDDPELFSKLNLPEDSNPIIVFYHIK